MRFMVTGMLVVAALPLALAGCLEEGFTWGEAQVVVDEAKLTTETQALTGDVVEVTTIEVNTDFQIGQAIEDAVTAIAENVAAQIQCAIVTIDGTTVEIDFGPVDEDCAGARKHYGGVVRVTVDVIDDAHVEVHHTWEGLTNGRVTIVTGSADVSWDFDALTRTVDHEINWQIVGEEDRIVHATGHRVQSPLDTELGVFEGIEIEGERHWDTEAGDWDLDIDAVEIRWIDPVPQAGQHVITTPFTDRAGQRKALTIDYVRVDEDTIKVTLTGPVRTFEFNVNRFGVTTAVDEAE